MLTPEIIFQLVDSKTVMERYFPNQVIIGKKYKNPFRTDNKGGCYFAYNKDNRLVFYDMSHPEFAGDPIQILMLAKGLTFREALVKINNDFDLGISTSKYSSITDNTPVRKSSIIKRSFKVKIRRTHFQVQVRNWNKKDAEYWLQYGINKKLLKKYNVFPVKKYLTKTGYSNNFVLSYEYNEDDPCYCFKFCQDDGECSVKLYRPLSTDKSKKWRTNTTLNDVQGYEQLPKRNISDTLIITSSLKDLLTLTSIGYDTIAPQSEGARIPSHIIKDLKSRYSRIIIIYDADEAGNRFSKEHANEYGCEYRLLPRQGEAKDFADIRKQMTEDEYKAFVKNIIDDETSRDS
jgi:hypothetical protein